MKRYLIEYSAASDIGMRKMNQDNYFVDGEPAFRDASPHHEKKGLLDTGKLQLICVCDGIGGGSRGELASLTALKTMEQFVQDPELDTMPLPQVLEAAAEAAQAAVSSLFETQIRPGGCTLTMLGIRADEWAFLNIGDSPGFFLAQDTEQMKELSVRHNMEWEKRRRGEMPDAKDSCCLLRYLGKFGFTAAELADLTRGMLRPDDRLLLCSDGVTNAAAPAQLQEELACGADAARLVSQSARIPGADNCTAVCLLVKQAEDMSD